MGWNGQEGIEVWKGGKRKRKRKGKTEERKRTGTRKEKKKRIKIKEQKEKDLGAVINNRLTPEEHIQEKVRNMQNLLANMRVAFTYINQSIALTPRSLRKRPTRGWPRQTDLHLSLSIHSLLAHSNPFPLTPLSFTYSFTLSSHLPSGLPLLFLPSPLLKYTLLTNSSFPILSIAEPSQSAPFYPFNHTTPHPISTPTHATPLIHTLITQTIPSTHSTRSSQITHLNSTHS